MFCAVCKAMFLEISDTSKWSYYASRDIIGPLKERLREEKVRELYRMPDGTHHKNTRDLYLAADQGCPLCIQLKERFARHDIFQYCLTTTGPAWLAWQFVFYLKVEDFRLIIYDLATDDDLADFEGNSLDSMPSITTSQCCTNTKDEAVLDLGRSWLASCVEHHQACGQEIDFAYRPPRLLCLYGESIRLVERDYRAHPVRYATLSYCWGRHPRHLTLTAHNLDIFRAGFDISRLAKTFRDAFRVLKTLGIQWLWIDALCILQSGEGHFEDWQEHLVEMADIYANCAVNIAVDHAEDADVGCFRRRAPDDIKPCIFDFACVPSVSSLEAESDDRPRLNRFYDLREVDFEEGLLGKTPLNERGWVHQERLLSPRVLHFGKHQISWECANGPACETYPEGMVQSSHFDLSPFSIHSSRHGQWYAIVERFTLACLTNPADRLPAVAGIARRMQAEEGGMYAAGLFCNDLPQCLLWYKYTGLDRDCHESPYIAPSWSWAAEEGSVVFYHLDHETAGLDTQHSNFARVDDVQLQYAEPTNPFGRIIGGSLTITAPLLLVTSKLDRHEQKGMSFQSFELLATGDTTPTPPRVSVRGCLHFDASPFMRRENKTCLLFVSHTDDFIYGLLIAPHVRDTRGERWTRIGVYAYFVDQSKENWKDDYDKLCNLVTWVKECPSTTIEVV